MLPNTGRYPGAALNWRSSRCRLLKVARRYKPKMATGTSQSAERSWGCCGALMCLQCLSPLDFRDADGCDTFGRVLRLLAAAVMAVATYAPLCQNLRCTTILSKLRVRFRQALQRQRVSTLARRADAMDAKIYIWVHAMVRARKLRAQHCHWQCCVRMCQLAVPSHARATSPSSKDRCNRCMTGC